MIRTLHRLAAVAALALSLAVMARPAAAYCIINNSSVPLQVRLESLNALAGFRATVKPHRRVCCDYLYRKCNPTLTRNARLTLRISGIGERYNRYFCSGPIYRRTMATGDGNVTVTNDGTQLGGIRCDSRDFMHRDVQVVDPMSRGTPYLRTRPNTIHEPPRAREPLATPPSAETETEPEPDLYPELDRRLGIPPAVLPGVAAPESP